MRRFTSVTRWLVLVLVLDIVRCSGQGQTGTGTGSVNVNCNEITSSFKGNDWESFCVSNQQCELSSDFGGAGKRCVFTTCELNSVSSVEYDYPFGCPRENCLFQDDTRSCVPNNFLIAIINEVFESDSIQLNLFIAFLLCLYVLVVVLKGPRLGGYLLSKLITVFVLKPQDANNAPSAISIGYISIGLFGGKVTLHDLEYVSTDLHVRIVEASFVLRWWRSNRDVRHKMSDADVGKSGAEDDKNKAKSRRKRKLPCRLTAYFNGVECSVFNNIGKFDELQNLFLGKTELYERKRETQKQDALSAAQQSSRSANGSAEDKKARRKDVPWVYNFLPISEVRFYKSCLYVSDPGLPTTFITYVKKGYGLHYIDEIPKSSSNNEYDLYRVKTKFVWLDVRARIVKNEAFVGSESVDEHVRKVLAEDIQESYFEFGKKGVLNFFKDILHDVRDLVDEELFSKKSAAVSAVETTDTDKPTPEAESKPESKKASGKKSKSHSEMSKLKTQLSFRKQPASSVQFVPSMPTLPQGSSAATPTQNSSYVDYGTESGTANLSEGHAAVHKDSIFSSPEEEVRHARSNTRVAQDSGQRATAPKQVQSKSGQAGRFPFSWKHKSQREQLPEPDLFITQRVEFVLYYDEPGTVTEAELEGSVASPHTVLDIAVGVPGSETTINYGPWANRQRGMFLDRFLPFNYQNTPVYAKKLNESRVSTMFDLRIAFKSKTVWRVPYRVRETGALDRSRTYHTSVGGGSTVEGLSHGPPNPFTQNFEKFVPKSSRARERTSTTSSPRGRRRHGSTRSSTETSNPYTVWLMEAKKNLDEDSPNPMLDAAITDLLELGWVAHPSLISLIREKTPQPKAQELSDVEHISSFQSCLVAAIEGCLTRDVAVNEELDLGLDSGKESHSAEGLAKLAYEHYCGRLGELVEVLSKSVSGEVATELAGKLTALPVDRSLQRVFLQLYNEIHPIDVELAKSYLVLYNGRELELVTLFEALVPSSTLSAAQYFRQLSDMAVNPTSRLPSWLSYAKEDSYPFKDDQESDRIQGVPQADSAANLNSRDLDGPSESSTKPSDGTRSIHSGPLGFAECVGLVCGWLDIEAGPDTSLQYLMPWYSSVDKGSATVVNIEMNAVKVTASLTQSTILEANGATLRAHLQYPKRWNGYHEWQFGAQFQLPQIFLLRQHVGVFADLAWDWTSNQFVFPPGEPSPELFLPTSYTVRIGMMNSVWNFNVNDKNVIAIPNDLEYNTHISVAIPSLSSRIVTHMIDFEAPSTQVDWEVDFDSDSEWKTPCTASLILPRNHHRRQVPVGFKHPAEMPDPVFMTFSRLRIRGMYNYYESISPQWVDTVTLKFQFDNLRFVAYAEAIRAMLNFKDNYFGWDTNIISKEDYAACGNENLRSRLALRNWYESKEGTIRTNMYNSMDTHVIMNARNAVFVVPIALYPHMDERGMISDPDANTITLHASRVGVESRYFYNRFLEMSVNVSPVRIQIPSARNLGTSRMPFEDFMVTNAYDDDPDFVTDSSNVVHSPLADAYSAAAAAASSVNDTDKLYAELPHHHYQYEANNEFLHDKKYGISKLSTSQLIWDGLDATTLMLFGRGAGRIAPCVTYYRDRKVHVGTLRGDLQHAQIKAMLDASTTFEASWLQTSEDREMYPSEGVVRKPGYRFKMHLHSAMFLPKASESFYSFQAYAWAQVTCGGNIFHTQVIPDSSAPEWDCMIDFRIDNLHDLVVQVFDGAYGRKRLIGQVVFLKESVEKVVKPQPPESPSSTESEDVPDLGWYIIDASECAPCYDKVKTSKDIERQFLRYWKNRRNPENYCDAVKAEFVHGSTGSRKLFGKLRFGLSVYEAVHSARENSKSAMTDTERYTYASLRWGLRASGDFDVEDEGLMGDGVGRLVTALKTEDAAKTEAEKYAHNSVLLTCGGLDLSLWTPNGTGISKVSLSSFKMVGNSLISPTTARLLYSEDEIKFTVAHYISVPTRQYGGRLSQRPIPGTMNWRHHFKRNGHPSHHHHHHSPQQSHRPNVRESNDINHAGQEGFPQPAGGEHGAFAAGTDPEAPMARSYVWIEVGKLSSGAAVKLYEKLPCNDEHMKRQRAFFRIHDEDRQERKRGNDEVTTGVNEPWKQDQDQASIHNMQGGAGRIPLSIAHAMGLALMPMAYAEKDPNAEPTVSVPMDPFADLASKMDDDLLERHFHSPSEDSFQSAEEDAFTSAGELPSELSSSSTGTSSLTATDLDDSGYSSDSSSSSARSSGLSKEMDDIYVCASNNIKFPLQRAGIETSATSLLPFLQHFVPQRVPFMSLEYCFGQQYGSEGFTEATIVAARVGLGESPASYTRMRRVDAGPFWYEKSVKERRNLSASGRGDRRSEKAEDDVYACDEDVKLRTSYVQVVAERAVDVLVTPLMLTAIEEVLQVWNPVTPSTDQVVDAFQKTYLAPQKAPRPGQGKMFYMSVLNRFHVDLPGVHVSMLHSSGNSSTVEAEGTKAKKGKLNAPLTVTYSTTLQLGRMVLDMSSEYHRDSAVSPPLGPVKSEVNAWSLVDEDATFSMESLACKLAVVRGVDLDVEQTEAPCLDVAVLTMDRMELVKRAIQKEREETEGAVGGARKQLSFNCNVGECTFLIGTDSPLAIHSSVIQWVDSALSLVHVQTALYHRRRLQWAILAGEVIRLAHRMQFARARETSRMADLMELCPASEWDKYHTGTEDSLPRWDVVLRLRRIQRFLPDVDAIEAEMAKLPIDRHADVNPISPECIAGITKIVEFYFPAIAADTQPHTDLSLTPSAKFLEELLDGLETSGQAYRKGLGDEIDVSIGMRRLRFVGKVHPAKANSTKPLRARRLSVDEDRMRRLTQWSLFPLRAAHDTCTLAEIEFPTASITKREKYIVSHKKEKSGNARRDRDSVSGSGRGIGVSGSADVKGLHRRVRTTLAEYFVLLHTQALKVDAAPEMLHVANATNLVVRKCVDIANVYYRKRRIHAHQHESFMVAVRAKESEQAQEQASKGANVLGFNKMPGQQSHGDFLNADAATLDKKKSKDWLNLDFDPIISDANRVTEETPQELNMDKNWEDIQREQADSLANAADTVGALSSFSKQPKHRRRKAFNINKPPRLPIESPKQLSIAEVNARKLLEDGSISYHEYQKIIEADKNFVNMLVGPSDEDILEEGTQGQAKYPNVPASHPFDDLTAAIHDTVEAANHEDTTPKGLELSSRGQRRPSERSMLSEDTSLGDPFDDDRDLDQEVHMDQFAVFVQASVSKVDLTLMMASLRDPRDLPPLVSFEMNGLLFSWNRFNSLSEAQARALAQGDEATGVQSESKESSRGMRGKNAKDFVMFGIEDLAAKITGDGISSGNWETCFQVSGTTINVVTAVSRSGSKATDFEVITDMRLLVNSRLITAQLPLFAIDHEQLNVFLDSWFHAYSAANQEQRHIVVTSRNQAAPPSTPVSVHNKTWNSINSKEIRASLKNKVALAAAVARSDRGLSPIRYVAIMRIEHTTCKIQPLRHVNITYQIRDITGSFEKISSSNINAMVYFGTSNILFDKPGPGHRNPHPYHAHSRRGRNRRRSKDVAKPKAKSKGQPDSADNGRVAFEQSLPKVWVVLSLNSCAKRSPISFVPNSTAYKHTGAPSLHARSRSGRVSLDELSLTSLANMATENSSGPAGTGKASLLDAGVESEKELVARFHIIVQAVDNKVTPDIVQQFLALQSGLANEINLVLSAISRFSEKFKDSLPSTAPKESPKRHNASPEGRITEAPSLGKIRYSFVFVLEGLTLSAMSQANASPAERPWLELDTGGFQLAVKSATPEDNDNGKEIDKAEKLWFSKVKFQDLRVSLCNSRPKNVDEEYDLYTRTRTSTLQSVLDKTENFAVTNNDRGIRKLFNLQTSITISHDPRRPMDDRSSDRSSFYDSLRNQKVKLSVHKTVTSVSPGFMTEAQSLHEEYLNAFYFYNDVRSKELGRKLQRVGSPTGAEWGGGDSPRQVLTPLQEMDRHMKNVWRNVKEPLNHEINDATLSLRQMAFLLVIENTIICVPFVHRKVRLAHRRRRKLYKLPSDNSAPSPPEQPHVPVGMLATTIGCVEFVMNTDNVVRSHSVKEDHSPLSTRTSKSHNQEKSRLLLGCVQAKELVSSFIRQCDEERIYNVASSGDLHADSRCIGWIPSISCSAYGSAIEHINKAVIKKSHITFVGTVGHPQIETDASMIKDIAGLIESYSLPLYSEEAMLLHSQSDFAGMTQASDKNEHGSQNDGGEFDADSQTEDAARPSFIPFTYEVTARMLPGKFTFYNKATREGVGSEEAVGEENEGRSEFTSGSGKDQRIFSVPLPEVCVTLFSSNEQQLLHKTERLSATVVRNNFLNVHIVQSRLELSPMTLAVLNEVWRDINGILGQKAKARNANKVPKSVSSVNQGGMKDGVEEGKMFRKEEIIEHSLQSRWHVNVRVDPFDIVVTAPSTDISAVMTIPQPIDVCWSDGPMYVEESGLVLALGCTSVAIPSLRFSVNELAPFIDFSVMDVHMHMNKAYGLRADNAPFCTAVIQVAAVESEMNAWKLDKYLELEKAWQVHSKEFYTYVLMRATTVPTQAQTSEASSTSMEDASRFSQVQRDDGRLPYNVEGNGSSDADADYTAGTETVHSMMQDYDSFEELEPEAYNEARTLFIQLRLTSLKVDFNLGTLYTKGKVEVEGVAARLVAPGKARGQTQPENALIYAESESIKIGCNGRVEGDLVLEPGIVFTLERNYREKPALEDLLAQPIHISANELLRSMQKPPPPALDWQPWLKRKKALNLVSLECPMVTCQMVLVLENGARKQRTLLFVLVLESVSLRLRDKMELTELMCTTEANVSAKSSNLQTSSETVPVLVRLLATMQSQVEEARTSSMKQLETVPNFREAKKRVKVMMFRATQSSTSKPPQLRALEAVGDIVVKVEKFDVSIIHGLLSDEKSAAAAAISVQSLLTGLRIMKTASKITRSLILQIKSGEICRFQQLLNSHQLASHAPAQPLNLEAYSSGSSVYSDPDIVKRRVAGTKQKSRKRVKQIFGFPSLSVEMDTVQELQRMDSKGRHLLAYIAKNEVLYKFRTGFSRAIEVSTDIRDYTYLKNMAASCDKSIDALRKRGEDSKLARKAPPPTPREFKPDMSDPSDLDTFVFDPQLNVIGEATNMALGLLLSRLDIDKHKLPDTTHAMVADQLEAALAGLRKFSSSFD